MTISNLDPKIIYDGNGTTKTFAVPFEFFDPEDLLVKLYPDKTDENTFQTLMFGSDYSVSGGSGEVGSLTTTAAYPVGSAIEILSNMPYGQDTAYAPHTPFQADAHERALDRLAVQIKQVASYAGAYAGTINSQVFSVFGRSGDVVANQSDYAAFYANVVHVHSWAEITGKPANFPPSDHTHDWSQVTGKPTTFTPSAHVHSWGEITSKPATFTPSAHTHVQADITDLDVYSTAEVDAIFNSISRPYLNDLQDVSVPLPAANDVLSWDATVGKWIGRQVSGGGGGGGVDSVFGRSGVVTAQTGDYTWAQISNKPSTYPPSTHSHIIADVTGLQNALDLKSDVGHTHQWGEITSKPTEFPPEAHTHTIANVTGLQQALDGKAALVHTHLIADITGLTATLDSKQNIGIYANVLDVSASREIANTDLGKLLVASAAVTLTLNTETMAVGSRVDLIASGGKITIAIGGTKTVLSLGSKLGITTGGGAATLTKISSTQWHLGGSLE